MVFDPVEFLGRPAVLVPRPRINLVLYYGVLGPRAAWRREVIGHHASETSGAALLARPELSARGRAALRVLRGCLAPHRHTPATPDRPDHAQGLGRDVSPSASPPDGGPRSNDNARSPQPQPQVCQDGARRTLTMQGTFGFDVLMCPQCGGRLRLIALIEDAAVVGRILRHLGMPTEIPAPRPARAPPLAARAGWDDDPAVSTAWS
jgi:hypothetical protein